MTRIFLIRHGEAEGNLYRRAQGQFDTPLTPRGRAQAEALAARFADIRLDAVWSSDLARARETAEAAARGSGVTVRQDPRLREIALGVWEDMPWGNIEERWPEQLRYFSFEPHRWSVPGSETLESVQNRMEAAVLSLAEAWPDGTVAVASHGMAIRALLARVTGVRAEEIRRVQHPENTAVALLTAENGRLALEYSNDFSHLSEALLTEGRRGWWRSEDGSDKSNLRFSPFDTEHGRELFLRCYRDAWQIAHGSLEGFHSESVWKGALYRASASPEALLSARAEDSFAGLIALDEKRGAARGIGWISFCYVPPELRRRTFGIQLIGAAVSRFRALGRRTLRLSVAPQNPALGFYEHLGFVRCGTEPGALEPLLMLEQDLTF